MFICLFLFLSHEEYVISFTLIALYISEINQMAFPLVNVNKENNTFSFQFGED
jgi:hypothetical protein